MNPRLQYCLQEYKFTKFKDNKENIKSAIANFQSIKMDNLPDDKLDIFESHIDNASSTFKLVEKLQKSENEYNIYIKDYRDLHFSVRKKQKKILKIEKRISTLEAEIRNLDKDNVSERNKIQLEIEDYKLEIDELNKQIPDNWNERNKEFDIIYKAKNVATKRYRKNVDSAYGELTQIKEFINDGKELEKLSPDIDNLKVNLSNNDFANALSAIDSLFEKLGEISGTEEFADKLDDLASAIDSDEIDTNKVETVSKEAFALFISEITWRKSAAQNLTEKIDNYELAIRDTIGLRLQSRLTKEQAKYVAKCKSVHRDISLNF